jgi:hypothetical protein
MTGGVRSWPTNSTCTVPGRDAREKHAIFFFSDTNSKRCAAAITVRHNVRHCNNLFYIIIIIIIIIIIYYSIWIRKKKK